MLINGFTIINNARVPFFVDSEKIGYVYPWRSSDSYRQNGGRHFSNGYEIHISLCVDGKCFEIGGNDTVFINRVPVENDRTENALKIVEYIQTIMMLERKDPPMELLQENNTEKTPKKKRK